MPVFVVCAVASRRAHVPYVNRTAGVGINQLLFSPERLLPSGDYLTAAACCWKRNWHHRPLSRYPPGIVPYCYWLLLMAGDVEPNPGPAKHPCGVCYRPVNPTNRVSIVTAVISGNIVSNLSIFKCLTLNIFPWLSLMNPGAVQLT